MHYQGLTPSRLIKALAKTPGGVWLHMRSTLWLLSVPHVISQYKEDSCQGFRVQVWDSDTSIVAIWTLGYAGRKDALSLIPHYKTLSDRLQHFLLAQSISLPCCPVPAVPDQTAMWKSGRLNVHTFQNLLKRAGQSQFKLQRKRRDVPTLLQSPQMYNLFSELAMCSICDSNLVTEVI